MKQKPLPESKRAKTIGISLKPDLLKRGRRLAFVRGVSFSALIAAILIRELEAGK